jgi:aspartate 1-decarboxylase
VPKIACSFVYFCRVQIEVVKSKLHRVTITGADLHYIGSITIDQDLLDAAHMISGEKVVVVNVNNGSRLETYIIPGERGSGEVTMNGPAARLVQKGDVVIVFSYALMEFEEAKAFKPWVVFPDEGSNSLK